MKILLNKIKNNKFFCIICLVSILILIWSLSRNNLVEKYEDNIKISVIILNYNRPHNLEKNLPILNEIDIIDEIIVSHGSEKYYKEFKYSKVKNIKDYEDNDIYGGARRFLNIKYVKNNIVLFMDDDMYIDNENVYKLYNKLIQNYNKNTIYGATKRLCTKNGYKTNSTNYNTILTQILITKKSIIKEYLNNKIGWNKYKNWLKEHKGNCEDLSLNIFIREYYKENPVYVNIKYKDLDMSNGYSSENSHYKLRNKFCKLYN
tara:strand:+ start:12 stop:794 length:783 start_codon:yes stop_codon:yes gene_type:complete